MKLENQCCSLELAKRLKELGCKQERLWWWIEYPNMRSEVILAINALIKLKNKDEKEYKVYAAFTVAELGEMLPVSFMKNVKGVNRKAILMFNKYSNSMYQILYNFRYPSDVDENLAVVEDTEANARAKMLVYLKEKGLMK